MKVKAHLPHTILIVDDDKSITGALALILKKAGYDVLTANSAGEARSEIGRAHV